MARLQHGNIGVAASETARVYFGHRIGGRRPGLIVHSVTLKGPYERWSAVCGATPGKNSWWDTANETVTCPKCISSSGDGKL
jgi:hypothetical protein